MCDIQQEGGGGSDIVVSLFLRKKTFGPGNFANAMSKFLSQFSRDCRGGDINSQ